MIPLEVDKIAIPNPFNTLGTSVFLTYTRKPGLEIRFKPVITRSLFLPYFKATRKTPCLLSSIYSTSRMKPSRFNNSNTSNNTKAVKDEVEIENKKLIGEKRKLEIFEANKKDIEAGEKSNLALPLLKRLKFDDNKLNEVINKYANEKNRAYLNKVVSVLIEGPSEKEGKLMGYTDTMKLVNVKADEKYLGKIVDVKITDIKTWSLTGEIID